MCAEKTAFYGVVQDVNQRSVRLTTASNAANLIEQPFYRFIVLDQSLILVFHTQNLPKAMLTAFPSFLCRRHFSRSAPPNIFHPQTKALQKARAALSPTAADFDYLRDEIATRLIDRLRDIPRPFPHSLDLYCGAAHVLRALNTAGNPANIERLWHADIHHAILRRAQRYYDGAIATPECQYVVNTDNDVGGTLQESSLDLIVSAGGLHWVNNLPGVLETIRRLLKPDGLFMGAMVGGDTLHELRISMQLAEEQLNARLAPRVSPMVRLRDMAGLLSGVGMALVTVDVDTIVVPFRDMGVVMKHLRGMGETNALVRREVHYGRRVFERAARIYEERFSDVDSDGNKYVTATFDIVNMIGWAPATLQPRAAQRGSANFSLSDLQGLTETVVPKGKSS